MTVIKALSYLYDYTPVTICEAKGELLYSGKLGDAPLSSFSYGRQLEDMFFDPETKGFMVVVSEAQH